MRSHESSSAGFVFSPQVRRGVSIGGAVVGALLVGAAALVPDGADWYLATLVVAAAPFATAGLFFAERSRRDGPEEYRGFWTRWLTAAATAYAAGTVALLGVLVHSGGVLVVAVALLIAAVPLWASAGLQMLRAQAGRRTVSVDLLDATVALLVLGTPAVLVFADALQEADHPAFVLPFVASMVLVPPGLYLSFVNLARVPRGERATQGIALALGAAFAVNVTVQVAQVLSDFTLPMPVVVLWQVLNMGLLMAVPLWAHRSATIALEGQLPEDQVRRVDPFVFTSAAVLPVLALFAWATRGDRPWGVPLVLGVLLAVVGLGAFRQAALARETRRLYAELEQVAEERRQLLSSMVRALEDDRRRIAGELHVQAVESFAALGAVIQGAYATLPPATAVVIKEALSQVQDDVSARADALRALTAAVRPPSFTPHGDDPTDLDGGLAAALRAMATEELGPRSAVRVPITVDPELVLDWTATTIVYRIAQEAVRNAARHSRASTIAVEVAAERSGVVVQVRDDGGGFDVATTAAGTGTATMQLFAELGNGSLETRSEPGRGTTVRATLGGRRAHRDDLDLRGDESSGAPGAHRRLLLVATDPPDAPA
jgi:signal transduction histidine kinase